MKCFSLLFVSVNVLYVTPKGNFIVAQKMDLLCIESSDNYCNF